MGYDDKISNMIGDFVMAADQKRQPAGASAGYAHGVDTLDSCAQCNANAEFHCTAGRAMGRDPHDLGGAWLKCNQCGNTITVFGGKR